MHLLRFAIAAACGAVVTGLVFEHRGQLEQFVSQSQFWELSVGRAAAAVEEPVSESEPDSEPIALVPVTLPEATPVAVPTNALEPVWQIVDATPATLDSTRSAIIRTVSDSLATPVTPVAVTKTPTKNTSAAITTKWEVIGQSAGNRPIHIRKTGIGSDVTLIVGGLDGEDRIAVKWIDQLSQRIDEGPELVADRQLILLRAVNPDGLTIKQTANSHGVVLNRNFPTAAYQAGGQPSAGPGPASEPETRVLLKLLAELRPQRIIHVQSAHKTVAVSNTKSLAAVQAWQQALNTRPQPFDASHQPGSLEDYAATVLNLEVISLQLPTGDDWRSAGLTHVPTLLAMSAPISAMNVPAVALVDPATDHSLAASPFSAAIDEDETPAPRPTRKGYEELPPPPFKPNW
jgi:protein MpaA